MMVYGANHHEFQAPEIGGDMKSRIATFLVAVGLFVFPSLGQVTLPTQLEAEGMLQLGLDTIAPVIAAVFPIAILLTVVFAIIRMFRMWGARSGKAK